MDERVGKEGGPSPAKGPRLYHKKSRNGCVRCRARKVKCDEKRPICASCARHSVPCVYEKYRPRTSNNPRSPSLQSRSVSEEKHEVEHPAATQSKIADPLSNGGLTTDQDAPEIPESTTRRLLELQLLHHFITKVIPTLPASHRPLVFATWTNAVPELANDSPPLLNALLSISALHLSRINPEDCEIRAAHRTYLDLSLRAHRKVLGILDAKTADATCFTSSLIFIDAYAALQGRTLPIPYEPPMQWLLISNSAWDIFHISSRWIRDDPTAAVNAIIRSAPTFADSTILFNSAYGQEFRGSILPIGKPGESEHLDDLELQDKDIKEAYDKSIAYLGSVNLTIRTHDHVQEVCRWLLAFAVMVPRKIISLIEEKRPRALVVLAHYFAMVGALDGAIEEVWWVGKIGKREVQGIWNFLPEEWKTRMKWPMEQVGLSF